MNELVEHQTGEGGEMQPGEHGGQALIVTGEAAKAAGPGEAAFHDPALGQEHEAVPRGGQLDHLQLDALRVRGGAAAGSAPVSPWSTKASLNVLARRFLHRRRQACDLGAILFVGRGHVQRQELAQRVDGGMDFGAFAPFVPIVPCPCATFRRRLDACGCPGSPRWAVRCAPPATRKSSAQIGDERLKGAGFQPAPGLLVDDDPGRQIMGDQRHGAPLLIR